MIRHDFPFLDTNDLNLDWLLKNMKLIIKQWADYQLEMNTKFDNLNEAFLALKAFIESWFDDLDVQEEINNKIDAMKLSGELAEILNPIIASETSTWLAQHITNPSNPPIDTSLTVNNAAANAKTVGDKAFLGRANLSSNDDLNTLTSPGTYAKSPSAAVAHWPYDASHSGRVNVFSAQASTNYYVMLQEVFDYTSGGHCYRIGATSLWSAWHFDFTTLPNLTSNDDINALINPGTYLKSPSATPANWPFDFANAGRLFVYSNDLSAANFLRLQIAYDYVTQDCKYRLGMTSGWKEWRTALNDNNAFIGRAALTSNDDINTITAIGTYVKSPSAAPSNWAFTSGAAGRLVVFSTGLGTDNYAVMQMCIDYSTQNFKIRMGTGNGNWKAWYSPYQTTATIASGSDLDTFSASGTFAKSPNATIPGFPFASNHAARIINFSSDDSTNNYAKVQVVFDYTTYDIAYRIGATSGWYLWNRIKAHNIAPTKKLAIMGDSTSTFDGYSEAHSDRAIIDGVSYPYRAPYYPTGNVSSVSSMYWKVFADYWQISNITISAVSRSRFRDNQIIDNADAAPAPWFTDRINRIISAAPDIVIINMGINDLFGWQDGVDDVIPNSILASDLSQLPLSTARGAALTVALLQEGLPNAKIYGVIPKAVNGSNDSIRLNKVCTVLEKIYKLFAVPIIDLRETGITPNNARSYAVDGGTHPNTAGFKLIADKIIRELYI